VSFVIYHLTVKPSRPFNEGDFIKNCLHLAPREIYCTKCAKVSGSTKAVADTLKDAEIKLSEIFDKCVYCSLTIDESTDITSTAQICIFVRGETSGFEVLEDRRS
jgi:hypothetical protein